MLTQYTNFFLWMLNLKESWLVQAGDRYHFPPTIDWLRQGLMTLVLVNEITEENYRDFCERFSFLKRKRWAGKKVPPCFWLEC